MNCLIVEDEKIAAERLKNLLQKIDHQLNILAVQQSVKNTIKWLNENPSPDLAFFDIQLADGLSFEVFEQVEARFPIVFTTAYDEYALKAFKLNSIDYLLKPIDIDELEQAINKFKSQSKTQPHPQQVFDHILQHITQKYKEKFVVKVGEHLRIFPTEKIQCFYSADKAIFLQNTDGRDFAVNYSLDQLEELLDPKKFFRISRKHMVAFHAIADIISYSNSRLKIKLHKNTSPDIIVSRERVNDFKQWLEE